jgi:hypothetical protein
MALTAFAAGLASSLRSSQGRRLEDTMAEESPSMGELPTRDQILDFNQTADQAAGKREIAKAFGPRRARTRSR